MSRVIKTLLSAGLSAAMVLGTLLPVEAMPLVKAPVAEGNIELVQWGPPGPGYGPPPGYRPPPGYGPRPGYGPPPGYYRPPQPPRYSYDRPSRDGWYNGHRGYREPRPGHRYHNGYWFPLAAFAAGAIIGGALSQPSAPSRPAPAGINPKHYDWCASRYRSYRSYDNTFQPNYGPRQQCLSPYY